ncbi:MAG: hypothetical protein JWO20_1673, partial [Candidatus Angelobacter sp.]|nr:hypothetical protein [Candidatus Angelobacter sp.]
LVTTFKTSTHVVLLDVVVTDKHGQPVTDLKGDEVTILEKGKPQKLASFSFVDSKVPLKGVAVPERALIPGVYYNGPEVEASKGPITVLLLDALNTSFIDQRIGRQQMLKYIDGHQGERLAIFGLTDALLLLQNFTDDQKKLHDTIEGKRVKQTPLHPAETPGSGGVSNFAVPGGLDAAGVNAFFGEFSILQGDTRARITLDALKALGNWLSGYPGRKKLIWIADSFPVQLDPGETARFTNANSYVQETKETATLLTDAQISVYTINAAGLSGHGAAFSTSNGGVNGGARTGPQMARAIGNANNSIAVGHATMNRFSEETGGLAFYNRNDLDKALGTSIVDGSSYYALSYSPEDKQWDGNYRKLDIKTSRPGIQLRFRKGYYALNPMRAAIESPAKVDREINSTLVSPLLASGVSFYGSAQPVPSQSPAGAPAHAEIKFLVETKNISFESLDDIQHCDLKFFVGVYSGNILVGHIEQSMVGNVKPETFAKMVKSGLVFHTMVSVPAEKVRLRLIVRDNRSGKIGALDVPYPNEVASK